MPVSILCLLPRRARRTSQQTPRRRLRSNLHIARRQRANPGPNSESPLSFDGNFHKHRCENELMKRMKKENGFSHPRKLADIPGDELQNYAGVFLPGGHLSLVDFGDNNMTSISRLQRSVMDPTHSSQRRRAAGNSPTKATRSPAGRTRWRSSWTRCRVARSRTGRPVAGSWCGDGDWTGGEGWSDHW